MTETITILALILNFITLVIVGFQTFYTKKSLDTAKDSIELTKTSKQLESLPKMHHIINVTIFLEQWDEELKTVIHDLECNNVDKIIALSKKKPIRPDGLVNKYLFEKMPNWLATIYTTGAQYYYNSSCLYQYLWSEKNKKIVTDMYLGRLKESSYYLEVLLKYIKDEVPEVFLNCPASLNTSDFFEKI